MFSKIKGQSKAINIIKKFIQKNKLPSSMLFYGPEGVGKFLTAKELAKFYNCLNNDINLKGEDNCENCCKIEKEIFPDVFFIRPEKKDIKISQIREVITKSFLKPMAGKAKFFIIDNAENMNLFSENSFLKTLEEPQPGNYIILVTNNIHYLLDTIISRCIKVEFNYLSEQTIKEIILSLNKEISEDEATKIALFSAGSMSNALKLIKNENFTKIFKTLENIITFFSNENFDFLKFNEIINDFTQLEIEELKYIFEFLMSYFVKSYLHIHYGLPNDSFFKYISLLKMQNFSFNCFNRLFNITKRTYFDFMNTNVNRLLILENYLIEGKKALL